MYLERNTIDTSLLSKKEVIDAWLEERKQLLALYCELAGLPPYQRSDSLPTDESIEQFCEVLMDYVSAGHFSIYNATSSVDHLSENKVKMDKLYADIQDTTDKALNFNDQFTDKDSDGTIETLDKQLSELGQVLEDRFEKEDALVHILYQKNN